MPTTLATVIHISDLHFSQVDPRSWHRFTRPFWGRVPLIDRMIGHDAEMLSRLSDFLDTHPGAERAELVVTGDVTGVGSTNEFRVATQYLGKQLSPPDGDYVGLHRPGWRDFAIPGNHDHWPGVASILGRSRPWPAIGVLPTCPYLSRPIPLGGHRTLRFLGVDSDADVLPWGWKRFSATGSCVDELARARTLPKRQDGEIRVLLFHHSRVRAEHAPATNGIEHASMQALDGFLRDSDIRVMLTGHVHSPVVTQLQLPKGSGHGVLEARCGTTTQIVNKPVYLSRAFAWMPGFESQVREHSNRANSLLVHTVEENTAIFWRSQIFTPAREAGRGFEHSGLPDVRIQVYP